MHKFCQLPREQHSVDRFFKEGGTGFGNYPLTAEAKRLMRLERVKIGVV